MNLIRGLALIVLCVVSFPTTIAAGADGGIPYLGEEGAVLPPRRALVIGINHYQFAGKVSLDPLMNAVRDAELMKTALENAGFRIAPDHFLVSTDKRMHVTKRSIYLALSSFVRELERDYAATGRRPIAAFYFAGHGLSALDESGKSRNYVLPSDFLADSADDISEFGISLAKIVRYVARATPALQIIILDACRNEIQSLKYRDRDRTAALTFGSTEMKDDAELERLEKVGDTYYFYSTQSRGKASDEGYFTKALATAIEETISLVRKEGSARNYAFHDLYFKLKERLESGGQRVDHRLDGREFRPLPTKVDFTQERDAWDTVKNMQATPGVMVADAVRRQRCLAHIFAHRNAYSYFYDEALAVANQIPSKDCESVKIDTVTIYRGSRDTPAPNLAALKGAIGKIDAPLLFHDAPLDKVATALTTVHVRAAPHPAAKPLDVIDAGNLVNFTAYDAGKNWITVSSPRFEKGYVSAQFVSGAYLPLQQTIAIGQAPQAGFPELESTLSQLGSSVIGDMRFQYSAGDGAAGLFHALSAYRFVTDRALPLSGSKNNLPVPAVEEVPGEAEPGLRGNVRLTLLVLPLSKDVRAKIGTHVLGWQPSSPTGRLIGTYELKSFQPTFDLAVCAKDTDVCKPVPPAASATPPGSSRTLQEPVAGLW